MTEREYNQCVNQYADNVYRFIYKNLRHEEDARDVVQTAFFFSSIFFSPCLSQSMAAEVEATGRVFGFVAAFVTATDSLVLMGFSALFSAVGLRKLS